MQVDVVLISYNQEQYIAQAVESILMQRVNDDVQVRVIVADDSSKDKTLEIIKSYEEKSPFPFVYLQAEKNLGIAQNYKRAFEATEAEYVAVLEGDDWWTDVNRLQKHIDYLSTHIDCVMTKNDYMLYDHVNNEWKHDVFKDSVVTLRKTINHHTLVNLSCYVFRNNLLKQLPDVVYEYGEKQRNEAVDWYVNLFLLQYGYGYVFDELMSVYRINTGHNISLDNRTHNEFLDKAYLCYMQSLQLLGSTYKDECYMIYTEAEDCVKKDLTNRKMQIWSKHISPCIAELFFRLFPHVWLNIKHTIRQCIPHNLYYKIKKN